METAISMAGARKAFGRTPFTHLPRMPGGTVSAAPLLWLLAITAALITVGLAGLRRRDLA